MTVVGSWNTGRCRAVCRGWIPLSLQHAADGGKDVDRRLPLDERRRLRTRRGVVIRYQHHPFTALAFDGHFWLGSFAVNNRLPDFHQNVHQDYPGLPCEAFPHAQRPRTTVAGQPFRRSMLSISYLLFSLCTHWMACCSNWFPSAKRSFSRRRARYDSTVLIPNRSSSAICRVPRPRPII
jgi:hypothetical protein